MNEVHKVCVRFHTAIELLGGRWTGAVLRALVTGSHRFAEIKAAVPNLSDTMLSQRLRELEAAGLVERQVMATSPVHVEYQLTQMGREVNPVLDAVIAWSIDGSRFRAMTKTTQPVTLKVRSLHSGRHRSTQTWYGRPRRPKLRVVGPVGEARGAG